MTLELNQEGNMSEQSISLAQYLRVPEGLIAKYESCKGKVWLPAEQRHWSEGAHALLKRDGLEMPTPAVFMPYVKSAIAAYKNGERLYDGLRNELAPQEREDLYGHLTTSHINGGAWSWLNARFVAYERGFHGFGLETVIDVQEDGALVTSIEPLLPCVWDDSYVTLDFNAQGLPIRRAEVQKYVQGENLRFWRPRMGCVARFDANSGWAVLVCDRSPTGSSSSLGVFAFAREKNLKGIENAGKYLEIIARDERAITIDEEGVQVELLQRSAAVESFEKAIETLPDENKEIARRGFYHNIGQNEVKKNG